MGAASGIRASLVVSGVVTLAAILAGVSPVLAQAPPAEGSAPSQASRPPIGVGVVAPTPPPSAPEFGFETGMPPGQEGAREGSSIPSAPGASTSRPSSGGPSRPSGPRGIRA
jgi:hypothetical protein